MLTIGTAQEASAQVTNPNLNFNQNGGGQQLNACTSVAFVGTVNPDLEHLIVWTIDGEATGYGETFQIPATLSLTNPVHMIGYTIPTSIAGNPVVVTQENEVVYKFRFGNPSSVAECTSVMQEFSASPNLDRNQNDGGITLALGSTVSIPNLPIPTLIHETIWTIDDTVIDPGAASVTIPADLTPGVHTIKYVFPTTFTISDAGVVSAVDTHMATFDFTIAEPEPEPDPELEPVYIFDSLIFENQGPNAGGPTLEPGNTITITESTGSDLINQITWSINGVEQPDGAILTIPADIMLGIHRGMVVAPVITGDPITHTFEFTIGRPVPESQTGSAPAPDFTINPQVFHRDACSLGLAPGNTITITELDSPSRYDLIQWEIDGVEQPVGAILTIPTGLTNGEHTVKFEIPTRTGTDGSGMTTFESSSTYVFGIRIGGNPETCLDPVRGGGGNDWQKKPTFGKSYENTQFQVVEDGFVFNGNTLNIVDNWHTEFLKTSSIIGDTNNVKIKVYTDKLLSSATLQLGVPEIGKSSDAETGIYVMLNRNYTSVNDYDIVKIMHEQDEPLINTDETTVSIAPSHCTSDSVDMRCHTISFDFTIMAPLKHDVVAITATDNDRRSTTTFINEGVEFLGDSLLESATHNIHQKLGNQAPSETITLTQQDRRYQVWEDNNGYLWSQNDFGTFTQITHPDFVRYDDASSNVMTRINSAFDGMILDEQEKASLIFDSEIIQGTLDDSFTHVYPTGDKRVNMEILLLDEEARILLLLE